MALLPAGCGLLTGPSFPDRDPTSVGPIIARDQPTSFSAGRATIFVRAADEECGIIYVVDGGTTIRRRNAGTSSNVSIDDLVPGVNVAVWTDIVLTSCPGQAGAHFVEIR